MTSELKDDIENLKPKEGARTKWLMILITLLESICIFTLIENREIIDNVHRLLNSILLGILTAGLGQSLIQLFRRVYYSRLAKFCIWGAVNGILSSLWIDTLLKVEPTSLRILVDQSVGTPFFQSAFILFNCAWENTDFLSSFRQTFLKMLGTSYAVWPLCSIISFNFLPPHLIFPFNCFVNVLWTLALGLII